MCRKRYAELSPAFLIWERLNPPKHNFNIFYAFLHPKRYFWPFWILVTKILGVKKLIFFDFPEMCSKAFLLMNIGYWRLWGSVSDNFWVATVISSPCVKIRNFPKNVIFAIFEIFGCWSFRLQKSIKIIKKYENFFKNKLFISQRCFQIPRMTLYDHYI